MKKRFLADSLVNIIANAAPILILQLISLPIIANQVGGEKYGVTVTLISLFTILSFPFGNVLNNIRLLNDKKYNDNNIKGDFNIILIKFVLTSSILIVVGTLYYQNSINLIEIIFMIVISFFNLIREYLLVSYRLDLDYKRMLLNNLFLSLGYMIGTLIFYYIENWFIIIFTGYLFSFIYLLKHTKLLKEPFKRTIFYIETWKSSIILLIANIIKNFISYADKLLLFPLLGATSVSIYYTATIIGKIITMIINPVNNVILSYIRNKEELSIKKFLLYVMIGITFGVSGYYISIIVGPYALKILYSGWAEESIKLLEITSISLIFNITCSVIQPFILKFTNIKFQLLINSFYLLVYVFGAFFLTELYGLIGFSIAVLVSSIMKFIVMISIFLLFNKKSR